MPNSDIVQKDMHTAMQFVEKAKPIISELLNGGSVLRVEGKGEEVCRLLDLTCGTDYFQIYDKSGIVWGVASRFQKVSPGRTSFDSFTIRKERDTGAKTELEKRKYAIQHNGVYPYLTMQGYYDVETEDILSLGIAKTVDVIAAIESEIAHDQETGEDQIGQAKFRYVFWKDMIKHGYNVKVWTKH